MLTQITAKFYLYLHRKNLRSILLFSFIFISIIPIVLLQFISYYRLTNNFSENIDSLSQININRTKDNLELLLSSYEDILYQIYTDDELIAQLASMDKDLYLRPVIVNQIRRRLQALSNIKEWIEAISIITVDGNVVFYDRISGSYTVSSWLGSIGMTLDDIYSLGIGTNNTVILPTHSTKTIAKSYYLFHFMHRIIDYKNIERENGIVILTINEELLSAACNSENLEYSFGFIVDNNGNIISYPDKTKIGSSLPGYNNASVINKNSLYFSVLAKESNFQEKYTSIYLSDQLKNWNVMLVVDQSKFHSEVRYHTINTLVIGILLCILTSLVIFAITSMLSRSLEKVTIAMKNAEYGNLSTSINENDIFPIELKIIAKAFNSMMERMIILIEQINIASSNQRDAEIKALEAQINPHFLYNILDNINWMAVENEQYEISKMIVALAKMLRYSINQSNKMVTLEEDISWVEQYISFQQIRFKNNFKYTITIDPSLLKNKIYKLMLQPFIENAIIHGFKNRDENLLQISIWSEKSLFIQILDNGNGIEPELLKKIKVLGEKNSNEEEKSKIDEYHIGLTNAIGRMKMYYGNNVCFRIESQKNMGTKVSIIITENRDENCSS